MSNKMTIKRPAEPIKKPKKKKEDEEKKKFSFASSRMRLPSLLPAIVFIAIAIWYFVSSMK